MSVAPKRSQTQQAADREKIARLRLMHWTVPRIAAELGLCERTIQRDLRKIEADWKLQAAEKIATVKARDLARLDLLEEEALAEWERSKADYTKRIVEDRPAAVKGGGGRFAKLETGAQTGDPRYLTALLGIMERRARLIGADAPAKVAATNPDGTSLDKEHQDAVTAAFLAGATTKP